MPTFDGVTYEHSKRFDSDEEIDAFFETLEDKGLLIVKSDRSIVNTYLTAFWTTSKSGSRKVK